MQSRFLPGWIWLWVLKDKSGKLVIYQTNNQDNTLMMGVVEVNSVPIICLDVWEHSYWEDHNGEAQTSYIDSFWEVIDWQKVSDNFE